MICPLRLINISDQPDFDCVASCALLRMIDNGEEYNFICGLGEIPLAKSLINIVNFDRQPKPQEQEQASQDEDINIDLTNSLNESLFEDSDDKKDEGLA